MFFHHDDLAYTVRVDNPNPVFGRMLQQAIGGPEGELRVMSQYMFQGFGYRGPANDEPEYEQHAYTLFNHLADHEIGEGRFSSGASLDGKGTFMEAPPHGSGFEPDLQPAPYAAVEASGDVPTGMSERLSSLVGKMTS